MISRYLLFNRMQFLGKLSAAAKPALLPYLDRDPNGTRSANFNLDINANLPPEWGIPITSSEFPVFQLLNPM